MHFEVVSTVPCLIDAIGELEANVPVRLSDEALRIFKDIHGATLQKANFPPSVSVTFVVNEEPVVEEGGE